MNTLTLTLNKTNIVAAVKADTYITGLSDKSQDSVKNAALAYNEQAGDDAYHEVKMFRTLREALAKFEANMVEYVDTSDANATITDTLSKDSDTFTITATVGSRFNKAFARTLASLAESYIINTMLYTWWQSLKPGLAKDYYGFANDSLIAVQRCLSKSAPSVSQSSYDVPGGMVVSDPVIDGPTLRTIVNGTTDTINILNGSAASVALSPASGVVSATVFNGHVDVTATGTGSATVTVTTATAEELVVSYTVTAA